MTQENQTVHTDTPQECCEQVTKTKTCCMSKKVCRYSLLAILAVATIALIISLL